MATARTAYAAAASEAGAQSRALLAAGCVAARSAGEVKTCWARRAAIEHAYNAAVYAIAFPPALQADAHSLVIAAARLEGAMAGLAATDDPSRDAKDQNIYASASAEVLSAAATIRGDLGLPPPAPDALLF